MSQAPQTPLTRRSVFAGAGAVGALAAAAVVLPRVLGAAPEVAQVKPKAGGGYQVTEHVLRYYQTAKV